MAVLAYSAAAVVFTVVDRLDDGEFANSRFCTSPELIEDAGHFGALHCLGKKFYLLCKQLNVI